MKRITKSLAATAIIMLALAACGTATQDNTGEDEASDDIVCAEVADFAAEMLGWNRYEQPDGDPKHICPECAEKETMK